MREDMGRMKKLTLVLIRPDEDLLTLGHLSDDEFCRGRRGWSSAHLNRNMQRVSR